MSDSSRCGGSPDNEGRGFWNHPITQIVIGVLTNVAAGLIVWRMTT